MSEYVRPSVDLHVHTLASGHAYSTIGEIAREAALRGLEAVGMTDHGPALPGGPHPYHFAALRFIPLELQGVRIFRGVEANILGEGLIDLEDELVKRLDFVMVGFHEDCGFDGSDLRANTRAVLTLMERPEIRVIAHPGNPQFPLDYEALVRASARTGTALEFNNSSFYISRRGSAGNCLQLARLCAEFGAPVTVGSDAHIAQGVGEFGHALEVLAEAGVKPEQVVSRSLQSWQEFLGSK